MSWTLMLDQEQFSFTAEDLPAMIHGEPHAGASFFTQQIIAHLYHQGEPLIILSPDGKVRDELLQQIEKLETIPTFTSPTEIPGVEAEQILHLTDETLLPQLFSTLPDMQERVVVIFGFEHVSTQTITALSGHNKTIFFGDLNTSASKELLLQWKYNAKIFFSPLHNDFRLTLPPLEKYHGYFQGRISQGTVYLQETV